MPDPTNQSHREEEISLNATYPEDDNQDTVNHVSAVNQSFRATIDELSREGVAFRFMGLSLFVGAVGASMQLIPSSFDNRQNAATSKYIPKTSGIEFNTEEGKQTYLNLASNVTMILAVVILSVGILSLLLRAKRRFL